MSWRLRRQDAAKRRALRILRRHLELETDRERLLDSIRAGSGSLGQIDGGKVYVRLRNASAHGHHLDVMSDLSEALGDLGSVMASWEVKHPEGDALLERLSAGDAKRIRVVLSDARTAVRQAQENVEDVVAQVDESHQIGEPSDQQLSLLNKPDHGHAV